MNKKLKYVLIGFGALVLLGAFAGGESEDAATNTNPAPVISENNNDNTSTEEDTEKAETNQQPDKVEVPCPIEIVSVSPSTNSIGSSQADVTYTNNGTEAIREFNFYIVAWDKDGYPLKLNFGYDNYYNAKDDTSNTKVGETSTLTWTTYSAQDKEVGSYEVVPYKVDLYDGTVWTDGQAVKKVNELSKSMKK